MASASVPMESTGRVKRLIGRSRRSWRESTWGERVFFFFAYLVASAFAVVSLFPLYWMVTTAIKPPTNVMSLPPEWIPTSFTLDNFREAFARNPVLRWTINSLIVAVGVTAFQLIFATMAGYGFAKKSFPGREILFWLYISSMMVPTFAIIIPLRPFFASRTVGSGPSLVQPRESRPGRRA